MGCLKIQPGHGKNVIADKCSDIIGKHHSDLGKDEEECPLIPYTNDKRNNKNKQQYGVLGEIFLSKKPFQPCKEELTARNNSTAYS